MVFKNNKKANIQAKTAVDAMYNLSLMYHSKYNSVFNLFSMHDYRHYLAMRFVVLLLDSEINILCA